MFLSYNLSLLNSVGLVPSWVSWVSCLRALVPSWVHVFLVPSWVENFLVPSWVKFFSTWVKIFFTWVKDFFTWVNIFLRGSKIFLRGSVFFLRGSIFVLRGSKFFLRGSIFFLRGSIFFLRGSKFFYVFERGSKNFTWVNQQNIIFFNVCQNFLRTKSNYIYIYTRSQGLFYLIYLFLIKFPGNEIYFFFLIFIQVYSSSMKTIGCVKKSQQYR